MIQRTGEWRQARALLTAAPARLRTAVGVALRQEAHALRNQIVQGLTRQAPGGEPIRPPAPLTLAARQLAGFGGTKALLVRGDLRNSIAVLVEGDAVFIGVSRRARSRTGAPMANIAQLHELGGPPVIIPITPAMRRYLARLFQQAGAPRRPSAGRGVVVVQIQPRPFLRPAFNRFRIGAGRRFLTRVAAQLGLGAVS